MPCSRARFAVLAFAFFHGAVAFAQGRGLKLPQSPGEPLPVVIDADRIEGVSGRETTAQGNARLRSGDLSVQADSVTYREETQDLEARGNVRFESRGNVVGGPLLNYRLEDATGRFEKPEFSLAPRPPRASFGQQPVAVRGQAESIEFRGENQIRINDGYVTSCKPGDDSWMIRANQLDLDLTREVGEARGGKVIFKGVPVPAPPFEFPLNDQRKSGLLPPLIGTTGKSGPELAVPYYFNLAPNYDLTLTPRYMEKRGLQMIEQFRYLQKDNSGELKAEQIPYDHISVHNSRSAIAYVHSYNSQGQVVGGLNMNKVSDDDYFRDLATRINITSQATLPREGFLTYNGSFWDTGSYSATGRVQRFQVLQDPNQPIVPPYDRTPQVALAVLRQDPTGMDFAAAVEAVNFSHDSLVNGNRFTLYPSMKLPLVTPGAFLTPKVGGHYTEYSLSRIPLVDPDGVPSSGDESQQFQMKRVNRSLSIFSLDSGLIFERETRAQGQAVVQTLEPRLFYVYVPYKNQDAIPLFDTAIADFNYAQIFSENSFSGGDRINDANQLTAALTSRMLRADTGQEMLRATLGQRYYFKDQQVKLNPGDEPRTYRTSDWLAALSGRVARNWTAEIATQYNQRDNQTERLTVATRYQPEPFKTVNLAYRFLNGQIKQIDLSGQWPLFDRWYGVGRLNYSLPDNRTVENVVGLEYSADCWIARFVMQTFALTAGETTRSVFLQLELNGLSRLGSNPLEALKRNIPGYRRLGTPDAEAVPDTRFDLYD